ncbi:helix-turn-helix domain-containing protein [Ruminiclostridium josui]|uniref:helix-turn-helix domain-containing protein n=1 Tax=Ruminiclostridium josui TaxID=1499 RepID=UPI0006D11A72|nr:helix-turn-helix transcriptional regulator [Ruminiclostridium josui]
MFSKRLQFFMDKYNYSQAKLAELLGVSPPAINKMLKDGSTPGIENLKKLRKIFDTTIDFLLGVDLEDALEMLNTSNNEISIVLTNLRISKKLLKRSLPSLMILHYKRLLILKMEYPHQ